MRRKTRKPKKRRKAPIKAMKKALKNPKTPASLKAGIRRYLKKKGQL